jgi:hypothetical protein
MARGITDRFRDIVLLDLDIEDLAIAACRQPHASGERMCAQCLQIERAIRMALKRQGEVFNAQASD